MEELPRIWVDWNETWGPDLVNLHLPFTIEHFERQGIPIQEGVKIRLFGDDVEADAVIIQYELNQHKFLIAKIVEGTLVNVPFP